MDGPAGAIQWGQGYGRGMRDLPNAFTPPDGLTDAACKLSLAEATDGRIVPSAHPAHHPHAAGQEQQGRHRRAHRSRQAVHLSNMTERLIH